MEAPFLPGDLSRLLSSRFGHNQPYYCDYDPKVDSVMKYVGIDFTQKVENIDPDVLLDYVNEILEDYDKITGDIKKKSDELFVLAKKNAEMAIELVK